MASRGPLVLPENYGDFLESLKQRVRLSQVRAALAVNQELIMLYWHMGQEISSNMNKKKWGSKVVDRLSNDLKREFPEMSGFSLRNLQYMRSFAAAYPDEAIMQQVVAQLPWGHNVSLLDKLETQEERLWYAQQAIENGWSRDVLTLQITTGLRNRIGGAMTNFQQALPPEHSDLVQQILKSPYNFEFLTLSHNV